jgi:hypothetical protein
VSLENANKVNAEAIGRPQVAFQKTQTPSKERMRHINEK